MNFDNDKLGVHFTLPDKVTVRDQLAYFSNAGLAHGKQLFERFWLGAVSIIQNWKCDLIPDIEKFDLDAATDPNITNIVIWVGMRVKEHMDSLDDIPKN